MMLYRKARLLFGIALGLCLPTSLFAQTPKDLLLPSKENLTKQLIQTRQQRKSCKPGVPLEAKLQLGRPAKREQTVQLVFSVLPEDNLTDSEIAWDLSPGVEWLNGDKGLQHQILPAHA